MQFFLVLHTLRSKRRTLIQKVGVNKPRQQLIPLEWREKIGKLSERCLRYFSVKQFILNTDKKYFLDHGNNPSV